MSDLSRLEGVKGTRVRLYSDAGLDTLDTMARWNPEELRAWLTGFVKRTGFNGIAPTEKGEKHS